MSERFGIPDHSPQHAPDHAQQNPTPQGSWGHDAGGGEWPAAAPVYGGGAIPAIPYDPRRSIRTAVILAIVFGPLGLFYIGFLHGLVALFVVVPTARSVGLAIVFALGGRLQPLTVVVTVMWCITVPWAIAAARWRNAKLDRSTDSTQA